MTACNAPLSVLDRHMKTVRDAGADLNMDPWTDLRIFPNSQVYSTPTPIAAPRMRATRRLSGAQNIVLSFADVAGVGWITSHECFELRLVRLSNAQQLVPVRCEARRREFPSKAPGLAFACRAEADRSAAESRIELIDRTHAPE
jgi:hypothetical protein